jgi:hypothetical protein
VNGPVVDGRPFAHPPQAATFVHGGGGGRAFVGDLDEEGGIGDLEANLRLRPCAGVLERVGQRLLDDAKRGQLDPIGDRVGCPPVDVVADGQAGGTNPLDDAFDLCDPGRGARVEGGPSSRSTPSRRRISVSAWRPTLDDLRIATSARSGASRIAKVAPSANAIITDRLCATMSCISRAMRARSLLAAKATGRGDDAG